MTDPSGNAGAAGQPPPRPRRRRTSTKSTPTTDPVAGSPPSVESSASTSSPLGLTGTPFTPKKDAPPARTTRDLVKPPEPPKPEPITWTKDRVEPVLTGAGLLLHSLDPMSSTPHGDDLWKMTEDDLKAMGEPLARIANRYSVVREIAGHSDELAVGLGMAPYVKRNLAARGRAKAQLRRDGTAADAHAPAYEPSGRPEPAQRLQPARRQPETPAAAPQSPPGQPAGNQPESQPDSQPGEPAELGLGQGLEPVQAPHPIDGDVFELADATSGDLFETATRRDGVDE